MKTTVTIISINSKGGKRWPNHNPTYNIEVETNPKVSEMLEEAFIRTNADSRPLGTMVCSTSVGDVMIVNGNHHLVASEGFQTMTPQESFIVQGLNSRDTGMGLQWLWDNKKISV